MNILSSDLFDVSIVDKSLTITLSGLQDSLMNGHDESPLSMNKEVQSQLLERIEPSFDSLVLMIRSVKTHQVSQWSLAEPVTWANKVKYWRFTPSASSIRRIPSLSGWAVFVFNR